SGGYRSLVTPISSLSRSDLAAWLAERSQPGYRAAQVKGWLGRGAGSFADMHDLPAALRAELAGSFRLSSLDPVLQSSADGGAAPDRRGAPAVPRGFHGDGRADGQLRGGGRLGAGAGRR